MAQVIGIHGIWQHLRSEHDVEAEWRLSLPAKTTFTIAFYGDLFRAPPRQLDGATEFTEQLAETMLKPDDVPDPKRALGARNRLETLVGILLTYESVASLLSETVFKHDLLKRYLHHVHRYLHDDHLRERVKARVTALVDNDTRVLLAHSLGSVVAYEALFQVDPEIRKRLTLITVGSPLALPGIIFDKLDPRPSSPVDSPSAPAVGRDPGVRAWVNIFAPNDPVSVRRALSGRFDCGVTDIEVDNGYTKDNPHKIGHYLTSSAVAAALAEALT